MKRERRARRAAIATALAAASLAGCALLGPAPRERSSAVLDEVPAGLPRHEMLALTLLVVPPQAQPGFDTTAMAYSRHAHELAYFRDHQWAATPSQMLQPLVVRTLEATGFFSAVVTPPYAGCYSYALRTQLVELVQDFASEPGVVRLALRARLSDGAELAVVASEIALREPIAQPSAEAGVAAANAATVKALRALAQFVLESAERLPPTSCAPSATSSSASRP